MGQRTFGIDTRFAPYIEELQACAASRGVPFGAPGDLAFFVQQLAAPGPLRSEVGSLVRATIFREQEAINTDEVLELLAVAIGGPDTGSSLSEWQDARRPLQVFVGEIFRHLWSRGSASGQEAPMFPVDLDAPEPGMSAIPRGEEIVIAPDLPAATASPRAAVRANTTLSAIYAAAQTPPYPATEQAPSYPAAAQAPPYPAPHLHLDLDGMTSERSLPPVEAPAAAARVPAPPAMAAQEGDPGEAAFEPLWELPAQKDGWLGRIRSLWRDPEPEVTEEGEYPQYSSLSLSQPERRQYVLLGIGGLLFGAALGTWLWRVPATAPAAAVHGAAVPATAPVADAPDAAEPAIAVPPAGTVDAAAPPRPALSKSGNAVTNRDWDRALASASSSRPAEPGYTEPVTLSGSRPPEPTPARRPAPRGPAHISETRPPASPVHFGAAPLVTGPSRTVLNGGAVSLSVAGPMAANLLSAPAPQYPASARAAGVQGEVMVQAVVGLGGDVVATRVISGPGPLRDAAQTAVHHWRFVPYLVGGRPSMFTTEAVVDFRHVRDSGNR